LRKSDQEGHLGHLDLHLEQHLLLIDQAANAQFATRLFTQLRLSVLMSKLSTRTALDAKSLDVESFSISHHSREQLVRSTVRSMFLRIRPLSSLLMEV